MMTARAAQVLRQPEVTRITGLSRSTIYRLMPVGKFPKGFKLGERAVGWRAETIETWIAEREAANDAT